MWVARLIVVLLVFGGLIIAFIDGVSSLIAVVMALAGIAILIDAIGARVIEAQTAIIRNTNPRNTTPRDTTTRANPRETPSREMRRTTLGE